MECPICGTTIDRDKYRVAEHLGSLGYLHLDYWLKCPNPDCCYSPCFGQELSDAKPIYWFPPDLTQARRNRIKLALDKYLPTSLCPFCSSTLTLHKVWNNTWRTNPNVASTADIEEKHRWALMFRSKKHGVNIPTGILAQYKCPDQSCKYVRFVTL